MSSSLWKWAVPVGLLAVAGVWGWAQEVPPVPIDTRARIQADGSYRRIDSVKTQLFVRQPDGSVKSVFVEGSPNPSGLPLGAPAGMSSMFGAPSSLPVGEPMRVKLVPRTVYESQMVPISESELRDMQSYQTTLENLRNERTPEEDKADDRVMLANLVATQFDRDLESREKDVVELEAKVKKLREQLDKRKAAREKIVELRLTTIQNEIDGLGFPGTGSPVPPGESVNPLVIPSAGASPIGPPGSGDELQPIPDPDKNDAPTFNP